MFALVASLVALLVALGLMLLGLGLLTSLVPLRLNDAGYSTQLVSLVATAYFIGAACGAWYCPRVIRRVGHIRAYAGLGAILAAATLALALFATPAAWLALRLVSGFSLIGAVMAIESWLSAAAPADWRGRLLAIYMATYYGAFAGGQMLLNLYPIEGLELFVLAAMLIGLAVVPVALTRRTAPALHDVARESLAHLFAVSPLAVIGSFLTGIVIGAFYGLGAIYGRRIGLDTEAVALMMAVTIAGGLVLQWPMGWLSDLLDRRSVVIGLAVAAAAVSLAIAGLGAGNLVLLLALLAVLGGAIFAFYPLLLANANDYLPEGQDAVSVSSGLTLVYAVGMIAGPQIAAPAMTAIGDHGLFLFIAAVCALFAGYGAWRVTRRAPVPQSEQSEYVALPRSSPIVLDLDPRISESDLPQDDAETDAVDALDDASFDSFARDEPSSQ
jgi:MFS family permease